MSPSTSTASGCPRARTRSTAMMTLPIVSAGAVAGGSEEMVRRADLEVVEEDLVELVVVVLAGVDEQMVAVLIELGDDPRQADDLRPRPDDRHHLKRSHSCCARGVTATTRGSLLAVRRLAREQPSYEVELEQRCLHLLDVEAFGVVRVVVLRLARCAARPARRTWRSSGRAGRAGCGSIGPDPRRAAISSRLSSVSYSFSPWRVPMTSIS